MELLTLIKEDLAANTHAKSKFILFLFRICHATLHLHPVLVSLFSPMRIMYRILVDWILGVDIPCRTTLGRRVTLYHSHSLVINENAVIGDDCILRHCVTIGNKLTSSGESSAPIIGNCVEFGAGCAVIGPIEIGDNVTIGALTVVTRSIPSHSVIIGNPARILTESRSEL